jgi:hypothetical protein
MNIQVRAALRTLTMLAIAALVPIMIVSVFNYDPEYLFDFFVLSVVACMIWMIYSINLGQLETEEKIQAIRDRRENMISNVVKDPE